MQKLYNLYILYKCKKKIKRKKQYKQNKNIKKKYNRNSINKNRSGLAGHGSRSYTEFERATPLLA